MKIAGLASRERRVRRLARPLLGQGHLGPGRSSLARTQAAPGVRMSRDRCSSRRRATTLETPRAPIRRRNRVADDRACTRVTLSNFHGKEGVTAAHRHASWPLPRPSAGPQESTSAPTRELPDRGTGWITPKNWEVDRRLALPCRLQKRVHLRRVLIAASGKWQSGTGRAPSVPARRGQSSSRVTSPRQLNSPATPGPRS
jgi:hypothetical protein